MKKSEDELAEMFYEECMEQAGIEDYPPLSKDKEEEEYIRRQRTGGSAET